MDLFLKNVLPSIFCMLLYFYALMSIVSLAWQTLSIMNRVSCAFGLFSAISVALFMVLCHVCCKFSIKFWQRWLFCPHDLMHDLNYCQILTSPVLYNIDTGSRLGTRPDSFGLIVSGFNLMLHLICSVLQLFMSIII